MSILRDALKRRIREESTLFSTLNEREIDALLDIARVTQVGAKHRVFHKGNKADRFFALMRGRARVTTTSHDGRELVLRLLEPGDIFGEIAVLDGRDRTADVVTSEPCELLVIERNRFNAYLLERPEVDLKLMRSSPASSDRLCHA